MKENSNFDPATDSVTDYVNVERELNILQDVTLPCWSSVLCIQSIVMVALAPSVQRRKIWLTPTTRCRAVTLPRRETRWNLQGPKLPNRSQPLVDRSSPYYQDTWRRYCCLISFFPIVDMCLSCEDIARRSCAMVPRWRFWRFFCVLYLQRAASSTFQRPDSKFALGPLHV